MAQKHFAFGNSSSETYVLDFGTLDHKKKFDVKIYDGIVEDVHDENISGDPINDFKTKGVHVGNMKSHGLDKWDVGGFLNYKDLGAFFEQLFNDELKGVSGLEVDRETGEVSFFVQGSKQNGTLRGEDKVVLKGVGNFLPDPVSHFQFGNDVEQEYCLDFTNGFGDRAKFFVIVEGPNGLTDEIGETNGFHLGNLPSLGIENFEAGGFLNANDVEDLIDKLLTDPEFLGVSDVTVDRDEGTISFLVQGSRQNGELRGEDKVTLKGVGEFLDGGAVPNSIVGALADPDITDIKIDFDPDGDGEPATDRREDLAFTFDGDDVPTVTVLDNSYLYGNSGPIGHGGGETVRDLFGGSVGPTDGSKIVEFVAHPKPLGGLNSASTNADGDLTLEVQVGGNFGPAEDTIEIVGLDLESDQDLVPNNTDMM